MRGIRQLALVAGIGLSVVVAAGVASPASAATANAAGMQSRSATAAIAAVTGATKTPYPGKSAAAIGALAVKAAKGATSVHVKAKNREDDGTVSTIDLVLSAGAAAGSFSNPATGTFQVIRVKSAFYLRGNDTFWKVNGADDQTRAAMANQWIQATGKGDSLKEVRAMTMPAYWTKVPGLVTPDTRVAGQKVGKLATVGLRNGDITMYVAATGAPFPLLITDAADPQMTLVFTEWNKKLKIKAPKVLYALPL